MDQQHQYITNLKYLQKRLESISFPAFLLINKMTKKYLILFLFVFMLLFQSFSFAGPLLEENIESALFSAESVFKTMKKRDYPKLWSLLSLKSKDAIVNDVYKAEAKAGAEHMKENIYKDFNNGGPLSKAYWNSFLEYFNPDIALEQSKWDIGKFDSNKGEIIIKYRKAERPTILQIFKEQGLWKVGLVETFWVRKK